jgi:uncharacterized protein YPO0396
MQTLSIDTDNTRTGFRLHRLEVLNWGTFNHNVWKIEPNSSNSLLTGDIGSGKSTLVDAITTLLVPHHKITYNKAAGAENKERNILTYIRGEYKNEKDLVTNTSRPIYLRDENSYSVLLAHFHNHGYGQDICLAQVFWLKNNKPEKFFIVAATELNIKEHFTNFGKDILILKKELKKRPSVEVFDSFVEYSSKFRNIFGVKSDKALDLFYQTVSMKSVGNLTEFVRNQMLEKFDVKVKIDELKKRFEDLTESHKAVQKAKEQLDKLMPLVEKSDEYAKVSKELENLTNSLDALPVFFSMEKSLLIEDEVLILNKEISRIENKIKELNEDLEKSRNEEMEITFLIKNNAHGKRLNDLEEEIRQKNENKNRKSREANKYIALAVALDLPDTVEEPVFYQSLGKAKDFEDNLQTELPKLTAERDLLTVKLSQGKKSFREHLLEYESLSQRKTQIPETNLKVRESIIKDLVLFESDLPYVGELLKVKETEKDWEGAIEKILHGFGLSMLVPEEHYKRVSDYVNKTNLRGRLVYFRIPKEANFRRGVASPLKESLVNKVEIKPDTDFYDWIKNELLEKYNYICCEFIEQFQREPFAVTKEGQIKVKYRHEKDDRRNIFDRKNYILGWTNTGKLDAIRKEAEEIEESSKRIEAEIKAIESKQAFYVNKRDSIRDFLNFNDFSEINWHKEAVEIQALTKQKEKLENSSNELRTLHEQLVKLKNEIIKPKEFELTQKLQFKGKNEQSLEAFKAQLDECKQFAENNDLEKYKVFFPGIKEFIREEYEIDSIDKVHHETRSKINKEKNHKTKTEQELREDLIGKMGNYKKDYPAETNEVDVSINSLPEFIKFARKLEEEDLPKHEERFKRFLNEGAIQGIVLFKNQMEVFEKDIEDKIRDINKSLVEIDYNPGTYIILDNPKTQDKQIRDFKDDLRKCLENSFNETDLYNEKKFNQVRKILDRFNSGDTEDLTWTSKVTDVRNWFTFTVSEKWREDNSEKEFYSDSSGKSGGQKEKLAYTILASALAYQFGLEWHETKSKSFRFVVIDEAFGRGSDESTRYGLELFKKLNLQLLIVTPLQKINIIEDYINSVHFVSNIGGRNSVVRNLSKTEYKKEKVLYLNVVSASNDKAG